MAGRSQRHLRELYQRDSSGEAIPRNLTVPTKAGTATQGETLTGTSGTFDGYPTPTVTRAWTRNGALIAGATAATYVLALADVGALIRFRNYATNTHGQVFTDSTPTTAIAGA
jgi:hypothetical protein